MSVESLLPSSQLALEWPKEAQGVSRPTPPPPGRCRSSFLIMICPDDIGKVTSEHIRAFLLGEGERTSPAFAQQHHRNLHVCFRWIETEGSGAVRSHLQRGGLSDGLVFDAGPDPAAGDRRGRAIDRRRVGVPLVAGRRLALITWNVGGAVPPRRR